LRDELPVAVMPAPTGAHAEKKWPAEAGHSLFFKKASDQFWFGVFSPKYSWLSALFKA
jgi:hypothetical protein